MNFRLARHTKDIEKLSKFYCSILGLKILGYFEDHNNYDGVFVGLENRDWHIEFTQSNDHPIHTSDDDDTLVFYPTTKESYTQIVKNINANNIEILKSKNPYWDENGILIKDPDGFNIIVSPIKCV